MANNVIEIKGERFVVVAEREYRKLRESARHQPPPTGVKNRRPARETMQGIMGRGVLEDRERLGLTQRELADLAGIRQETISRLEAGKHSPNVKTMDKIDRALKGAARKERR